MTEPVQYLTLGVAEEFFAVPVDMVQEILDMRPIARLPQAPASLLGMIDVRGQGVCVADLRLTLALPWASDTENTRIIVLTLVSPDDQWQLALRADRVFEVTMLDEAELDSPPALGGAWGGRGIAGIGRRNGSFVTVLDPVALLDSVEPTSQAA